MKTSSLCFLICTACVAMLSCSGADKKADKNTHKTDEYLWVEVGSCNEQGQPESIAQQVIKLPGDNLYWVFGLRDQSCRIFGAIKSQGDSTPVDECDIRFRSASPLPPIDGQCLCRPGKFLLQEGRPTSDACCEAHPDRVYCK